MNSSDNGAPANPTIYDIAKSLGVSPSTVSRALSGSPKVGAKTRERVLEAAREANYSVNTLARNLRKGRAHTIEVIFPLAVTGRQHVADPFYLDMLGVIAEELSQRDYDMLFVSRVPWDNSKRTRQNSIDGMLMIGQGQDKQAMRDFATSYKKVVVWGAHLPEEPYITVGSDNLTGGRMATEHLIRCGRKRIAYFGDPLEAEIEQRRAGYCQALEEAGLGIDKSLMFRAPFDANRVKIAVQAAVASGKEFDGAVCGSDVIALNLIDVLETTGRKVPDDVAVVGYDDISLASSYGQSLTTISQSISVGGRLMVDKLFSLIEGEDIGSVTIPPVLEVRRSCGSQLSPR